MSETAVIAAVYPALARKTLEQLGATLLTAHRNDHKNPTLSAELRRAAATASGKHGVVGDAHVSAVANLAAEVIFKVLPGKHIEINEIPNVERTKKAFTAARRDLIIDMFGQAPLQLLAAWMLQLAEDPSLGSLR